MNNQRWCHNCGKQINPVKFCPECGASQASLDARPPEPEQARPQRRPASTFVPRMTGGGIWSDKEEEEQNEMPHDRIESVAQLGISLARDNPNLGLEIVERSVSQKETIGQVVQEGAAMPNQRQDIRPGVGAPVDTRLVLEEFKREAGGVPTVTLQGAVAPSSRSHSNRGD